MRAADERLRSWLRRAGRSANYGKNYGATKATEEGEETDEGAGFKAAAIAEEMVSKECHLAWDFKVNAYVWARI